MQSTFLNFKHQISFKILYFFITEKPKLTANNTVNTAIEDRFIKFILLNENKRINIIEKKAKEKTTILR